MLTTDQADRLMQLLKIAGKPLYLFSDDQDVIIDSEWFDTDLEALAHAKTLDRRVVYVLKHIGIADQDGEDYWLYEHD